MLRIKTVFQNTQGGAPYLSTMHFGGADMQADADDAVTAVGAFWGAVDAIIVNQVTWATDAEVLVVNPSTGAVTGVLTTTPQTGTGGSSAEALSRALQILVKWNTGTFVNGRRLIGHTYVPALTETANDIGNVTAAARTTVDTAAEALINDINSELLIWSRTSLLVADAVSATVPQPFAILRSRRD